MRTQCNKQLYELSKTTLLRRISSRKFFQAITWLMLSAGLIASPVIAKQDNKSPSKRFTAERVFDMEYANDPQISPDGKSIVYVRQSMDEMTDQDAGKLWVLDIKSGTNRPLIADKNASSPRWSPDGKSLVFNSSHDSKPEIRRVFIDSGMSFSLAQLHKGASGVVWSPNGKQLAFSMFVEADKPSFAKPVKQPKGANWNKPFNVIDDMTFRFDGAGYLQDGASQIFTLPAGGGTPRQVTFEEAGLSSPQWQGNNQLLLTGNLAEDRDLDPIESEIYQLDLSDLKLSALTTRDGPDHSPVVSPDGKTIAFLGYDDKTLSYQQNDLYLIDADGSNVRPLAESFAGSVDQTVWAPDGKSLLVLSEDHGVLSLFNISLRGKVTKVVTNIGGTSIGRPYAAGNFSVSKGKKPVIAFTAGFSDRPAEVGLVSLNGKNRQILTALNDDVLPYLDMSPIQEIKVKSSQDGQEIEAWIAFPPDFKADGTYPMILEIHGGPYAMYGPFFASEIQRYVDKVKTPTLLMVGEEDYRTPAWEAEQYYTALKMLEVDTALIRVPSAPHYIASRPSRLISKTDNIMGWFAKYDPAKKESSETESEDVRQ